MLDEWFSSLDNNRERSGDGGMFSEYSSAFEALGFETLLDLEGVQPGHLFNELGIPETEALRLLNFAEEDIQFIRRNGNSNRTRT